ncbi:MAG: histone [Candidatus Micrarchaeota archaeon]
MKNSLLPALEVERLIRNAGADRVSEEAGAKLRELLEDRGIEIVEKAIVIAKYAKKRRITRKEIELAVLTLS